VTPAGEGRANDVRGGEFPQDFVDFIHALNAHGVEYLLVGGYAVGIHGHVRATIDIDFLYRPSPANVGRLVQALRSYGAPEVVIDPKHLATPGKMVAFGAPPTRIDLLASISGVTFDEAGMGALRIEVDGESLSVIGFDALCANKQASGRTKDLDDVKRLRKTARHSNAKRRPRR
jgi:hypothetical protein